LAGLNAPPVDCALGNVDVAHQAGHDGLSTTAGTADTDVGAQHQCLEFENRIGNAVVFVNVAFQRKLGFDREVGSVGRDLDDDVSDTESTCSTLSRASSSEASSMSTRRFGV
jgi:hypothetical protein